MKLNNYFAALVLSAACVALSATLILLTRANQRMQQEVQARQESLRTGILGTQGQQISSGVLQEMAVMAATNTRMRQVLDAQGYRLPPPATSGASAEALAAAAAPATNTPRAVGPKP